MAINEPSPIDVINFGIQHGEQGSVRFRAFNQRVRRVKFEKIRVTTKMPGAVQMDAEIGKVIGRRALVLVELEEEDGVSLKGTQEDRDVYYLFVVKREIYNKAKSQRETGLVLPPGAKI